MVAENGLLTLDEWYKVIEQHRADGGNSSSISKSLLKTHRTYFDATSQAFTDLMQDENFWKSIDKNFWDGKPANERYAKEIIKKGMLPEVMARIKSERSDISDDDLKKEAKKEVNEIVDEMDIDPATLTQSKAYQKLVTGLIFTAEIVPPPYGSAFMQWALDGAKAEDGYIHGLLKKYSDPAQAETLDYDLFRADMLKQFGEEMAAHGVAPVFKDERFNEGGKFVPQYVAQNAKGEWIPLTEDKVAKLMRDSADGKGPHVVITANHAFLEDMFDLELITKGYRKLLDQVTTLVDKDDKTKKTPLANIVSVENPDQEFAPDQTILIAAVQTRENNYLNLEQLFRRLHELKQVTDPKQDKFVNTSPIAKMMVRTILKSIAKYPDQIKFTDGTPPSFIQDSHVELRPDAAEIVRRAIFFGFSKGGNDFRDGMRLLTRTLDDNRSRFEMPQGKIEDIIESVSLTIQSLNELKLDPYYKERGVTVNYFSNRQDVIALEPDITFDGNDSAITYNGGAKYNGHHPGLITENLAHPYIMQHHQNVLACTMGKPAISFLRFKTFPDAERPGHTRHMLALETAPGTSDAMFPQGTDGKCTPAVMEAVFKEHGLYVDIYKIPGEHGNVRYELRGTKFTNCDDAIDKNEDYLFSRGTIKKLHDAFEQLRRDKRMDVEVSSATTDPCLAVLDTYLHPTRATYKDRLDSETGELEIDQNTGRPYNWLDYVEQTAAQMAKTGRQPLPEEVYNRRIDQINKFLGDIPLHMPLDAVALERAPYMANGTVVARAA